MFPVSVKGVVPYGNGIVLLKNERDEWELPGGKLSLSESLDECVRREVLEETGLTVNVDGLLDCWVYDVESKKILVIVYECSCVRSEPLRVSIEHSEIASFKIDELMKLELPLGYKSSVQKWLDKKRRHYREEHSR